MVRTVLRALGLLMSLVSFATLVTARGPQGEPSALERIPVLMDALQARVAAREAGRPAPPSSPDATVAPDRRLAGQAALPDSSGLVAGPSWTSELAPRQELAPSDSPPRALPTGSGGVKVNRGLP